MDNDWVLNQINESTFVILDPSGNNFPGLGDTFTLNIRKAGGGLFAVGVGTKGEIGSGWYYYLNAVGEADTVGPVSIYIPGSAGIYQEQNLEYVVKQRTSAAVEFTYKVVTSTAVPIDGVEVSISTDIAGANVVWKGSSDALGFIRDENDNKPYLDPGTYYLWRQLSGYTFNNPDQETVA